MRRNPHSIDPDSRKNPDDDGDQERGREGGIDPEPEAEPQRVARRTDDADETEEIDLAEDDLEELSEMEEELEAQKGDGPDA